jgi:carbon storage regulator
MLVLTRHVGEEIVIGGNIRVKVVAMKGRSIRVGITAPPSVSVTRLELLPGGSVGAGPPTAARSDKSQERGDATSESAS